jgi:choline-glycine betaine transporter
MWLQSELHLFTKFIILKIKRYILTTRTNLCKKLNHPVFWPPFLLLSFALIISLMAEDQFLKTVTSANQWILSHFDWLFSYISFGMVLLCLAVYFSPIGKWKIGGRNAKPILSRWRWFSIIICTTIAVGILFWGASEPLYHISSPPAGMVGNAEFAMSSVFMHWSITPYAIYTIPALLFALGYYNYKGSYSLGSMLFLLDKKYQNKFLFATIDSICLFSLIAGMSAVLGVGLLSLSGGIFNSTEVYDKPLVLGIIAIIIVSVFTLSAASGLLKGIRILSGINVSIFIIISLFVFIAGPTVFIIKNAISGLGTFALNFVPHSLSVGSFGDKSWMHSWTTFYWANWMAWAPVTALFLGRISYGYTVRQFILFNWLIPAGFGILWMSIFSGTSLYLALQQNVDLVGILKDQGPDVIIYQIFGQLPLAKAISGLFLFTVFLSYVTAADSNTEAMSAISSKEMDLVNSEPPKFIKFVWGILIGLVGWVMVSYSGIEGVKMLSNLGGLPSLLLLVVLCLLLLKLLLFRKEL